MIELSIAIPAYREEENLRVLLPRLKKVMNENLPSYEILILDTLTPLDNTAKVCAEEKVTFLPRKKGNSYGDAVRTAIAGAQGKWILFMDADGSHTPEFIPRLLEHRNSADVVVGSRYIQGGDTENPIYLIWMSRLVNLTYALVLNLKCKDVSNSFKLYQLDQLKSLNLFCDNFDIIEEMLFKLHKKFKIKITEVPFTFKKRMYGDSKRNLFVFMMTYFFTLLKLRLGRSR